MVLASVELMLYTLSFIFLVATIISLTKLIDPRLETRLIEFPVFAIYMMVTLINYFKTIPRWIVAINTVIIMIVAFLLNDLVEDIVTRLIA